MTHSAASLWEPLGAYTRPLQGMFKSDRSHLFEVFRVSLPRPGD